MSESQIAKCKHCGGPYWSGEESDYCGFCRWDAPEKELKQLRQELRELIERWRKTSGYDDTVNADGHTIQLRCADELEAVLDE